MYKYVKRLLDILIGLIGIIILVPFVFILKGIFLACFDYGDMLYFQERVGKDGKHFKMYKFRTMVENADEKLDILLKNERYWKEWEENQKLENDPRITKIGKILRKTSLDELPQMWNVLVGDMSLIGPRPLVPGELEAHGGTELYWKVKPGITGWWASHGRSDIDYEERLEMEYYYVRNCSLKTDLVCICKTIIAVIIGKGAK